MGTVITSGFDSALNHRQSTSGSQVCYLITTDWSLLTLSGFGFSLILLQSQYQIGRQSNMS